MLNRRRFMIGMIALILTILSAVIIMRITPRYTSEAYLLIDTRKTDVVDQRPVVSPLQPDAAAIKSELDVIHSRRLASKVVEQLGLQTNPIFTKGMIFPGQSHDDGQNMWTRMLGVLPAPIQPFFYNILGSVNLLPKPNQLTVTEMQQATTTMLVNKLLDDLTVTNNPAANTIKLSYVSENPRLAAQILNKVIDLYLDDQLEAKFDATKRANTWLSKRLAELKQQSEEADAAVAAYRAKFGLTTKDVAGTTVATQQLAELNTQLITAEADKATKEGALRQFQDALKKNDAAAASTPEVIASPLITQLRAAEADIIRRKAELTEKYGERHPAVINVNAELRETRSKIRDEINKIVQALAQAADASRLRVDSLKASLATLTKQNAANNDASVKLNELNREAQATRNLYDSFLARYKETTNETDLQEADARVINGAEVPIAPSFPNKKLFIAVALVASIMVGVFIAIMIERLDNGFRSAEDVEQYLHAPTLGLVPVVSSLTSKITSHILEKPFSPFSESVRSIRMQLRYTNLDETPKVILVTSSVPEEGKSLLALSFSREAAKSGQRTLLIDCDLRKPTVHKSLGNGDNSATLADLFSGDKDIEEVIKHDPETNMHYIVARAHSVPNPPEMFDSKHMRDFLSQCGQSYDLVVLDSPPVMAASDSAVLSKKVDATVFVVRWGQTPRPLVVNAIKQLGQMGTQVKGIILTRVNVKKHARYGTGDHAYYYGQYKQYGEKRA